mmetsp:Transcript_2761/g.7557  ORF Transcript_2761/g.7557 Transcript_2761/m.7557 type:complete len:223 (+) Transcript_2761:271-939(+)
MTVVHYCGRLKPVLMSQAANHALPVHSREKCCLFEVFETSLADTACSAVDVPRQQPHQKLDCVLAHDVLIKAYFELLKVPLDIGQRSCFKRRTTNQNVVQKDSQRPYIDRQTVRHPADHLWRHVRVRATYCLCTLQMRSIAAPGISAARPAAHYFAVRHHGRACIAERFEFLAQPKVCESDVPLRVQQNVFRLQIAVHETKPMHFLKRKDDLCDHAFGLLLV